jgi:hypothetical protein
MSETAADAGPGAYPFGIRISYALIAVTLSVFALWHVSQLHYDQCGLGRHSGYHGSTLGLYQAAAQVVAAFPATWFVAIALVLAISTLTSYAQRSRTSTVVGIFVALAYPAYEYVGLLGRHC